MKQNNTSEHQFDSQRVMEMVSFYRQETLNEVDPDIIKERLRQDKDEIQAVIHSGAYLDESLLLMKNLLDVEKSLAIDQMESPIRLPILYDFKNDNAFNNYNGILTQIKTLVSKDGREKTIERLNNAIDILFNADTILQDSEEIRSVIRIAALYVKESINDGYYDIARRWITQFLRKGYRVDERSTRWDLIVEDASELYSYYLDCIPEEERTNAFSISLDFLRKCRYQPAKKKETKAREDAWRFVGEYVDALGVPQDEIITPYSLRRDQYLYLIENLDALDTFNGGQHGQGARRIYQKYGVVDFIGLNDITTVLDSYSPAYQRYQKFFADVGITDFDYFLKIHLHSGRTKDLHARLNRTLNVMEEIKERRPVENILSVLQHSFGIVGFFRYTPERLIRQFDRRNDRDLKRGLVLMPRADDNGAWDEATEHSNELRDAFESFYEALDEFKQDYEPVIYEVADIEDIESVLQDSEQSKDHKFHFGLINGHGNPRSIQFGNKFISSRRVLLTKDDVSLFKGRFVDEAPVVLISCSTGVENGIGQCLSHMRLRVYAPLHGTAVKVITPIFNGLLRFITKYRDDGSSSIGNEYLNGEYIS